MGEVLRAVLEKNCTSSRAVFYGGYVQSVAPATGITTFVLSQFTIQCKVDAYFLLMGAAQANGFRATSVVSNGWQDKTQQSRFSIVRSSTGEAYSIAPQVRSNLNYTLNNWVTLDEYILFRPGELITVLTDVQTTEQAVAGAQTMYVSLLGIEYKMPSNKGNMTDGAS